MKLIALYDYICECYNTDLKWDCQRMSNYSGKFITDEELITIYLFAIIEEEKYKISSIYKYAKKYQLSWFPLLPSYVNFNTRLNRLACVFPNLVSCLLQDADKHGIDFTISVLDSMPIITCSGKRLGKVAPQLTNKGYCATKKLHYYGCKLHSIGFHRPGKLPFPELLKTTPASENDLTALRSDLEQTKNRSFFADKAYSDKDLRAIAKENDSEILTPVKLIKGESKQIRQFNKAADDLYSTAVSKIRQPIESFFNWLIAKTDIQRASKVRSANGLILHVFGKIAAALTLWVF